MVIRNGVQYVNAGSYICTQPLRTGYPLAEVEHVSISSYLSVSQALVGGFAQRPELTDTNPSGSLPRACARRSRCRPASEAHQRTFYIFFSARTRVVAVGGAERTSVLEELENVSLRVYETLRSRLTSCKGNGCYSNVRLLVSGDTCAEV